MPIRAITDTITALPSPGTTLLYPFPPAWADTLSSSATPPPLPPLSPDWPQTLQLLAYLLLFLAAIALLRLSGKNTLHRLFADFFSFGRYPTASPLDNTQPEFWTHVATLSLSFSVIATAIAFLGPLAPSWTTATIIFALLWAYQLAWTLLIFLLGWTFNASRCAAHATRTFRLANTVIGIASSPFLLSALFAPPSLRPIPLVAAAITAATCILVKYIKLITILFTHKISIFYMILYFCALEILPVIVLYKLWE